MDNPVIAVLMGSDSDYPVMENCINMLKHFEVPFEVEVCSAHRSPERAAEFAESARSRGIRVIIAAAGGAAHLAGVLAGKTTLPVIGVPCPSPLSGLDSLLSTVQMPAGIPVATVAVGNAGATNSAILAVQILAVSDEVLADKLETFKQSMRDKVVQKNESLQKRIFG